MHAVHTGLDRGEAIGQAHPAVAVPVPVDRHTVLLDDVFLDELHQRPHAVGGCVSDRVRQADPRRPARNSRAVQRLERVGLGPGGVFGHVHHRQAVFHGVRDGFLGGLEDPVQGPVFGVLPDGGRSDERRGLDRDPDVVHHPHDGLDVGDHGARRAVRGDGQLGVADLPGERPHLLHHARARPRQPDVGGHDTEVGHEVQQALFDVERGIADGGGLQAVAQRLVVQVDAGARPVERRRAARTIPVVDQLALIHELVSPSRPPPSSGLV